MKTELIILCLTVLIVAFLKYVSPLIDKQMTIEYNAWVLRHYGHPTQAEESADTKL